MSLGTSSIHRTLSEDERKGCPRLSELLFHGLRACSSQGVKTCCVSQKSGRNRENGNDSISGKEEGGLLKREMGRMWVHSCVSERMFM